MCGMSGIQIVSRGQDTTRIRTLNQQVGALFHTDNGLTNVECISFCFFRSCSVACYKQHQAESCSASTTAAASSAPAAAGGAAVAAASTAVAPVTVAPVAPVASVAPTVPKSSTERVSVEDLERLAADPAILAALNSLELQNILRRIDGSGTAASGKSAPPSTDEQRVGALEKYRASNSDFEVFVQNVLQVINKE